MLPDAQSPASTKPHDWLKEVSPELYCIALQYEQVEDWCLEPDLDPHAHELINNFKTYLEASPEECHKLDGFVFILAHFHTALCLQLLDLASRYDQKLGERLMVFSRECIENHHILEPEAKVLLDRLYRLVVNAYFSRLFTPATRLAVMASIRTPGED